jgi:hypothetical protein
MSAGALGRRVPPDWRHYELYPLTALTLDEVKPGPLVGGFNWYSNFDAPVKDSRGDYWIGKGTLGRARGGHCICLKPAGVRDVFAWWDFYDQGREGACVGFGSSRAMSLINRKRYQARWLWDRAKEIDFWPETNPGDDEGTSVRAAMQILRAKGHVKWDWRRSPATDGSAESRATLAALPAEGIAAYRWISDVQDALEVLGQPDRDAVPILNSWGRDYPHIVYMPADTLQRLIDEDGELAAVTDR